MPVWMEILINIVGYAGFIGIATFNKSEDGTTVGKPHHGGCCVS